MGYEIKLIVGRSGFESREIDREGVPVVEDDGEVYYPAKKDEHGGLLFTDRTEIWFQVYGMVELCCPRYDSHLLKLDWKNKESDSKFWQYFLGDTEVTDDKYGDYAKPVPVADVIEALEKDWADSVEEGWGVHGYRRFRWALGFLKSLEDENEAHVMLYGH